MAAEANQTAKDTSSAREVLDVLDDFLTEHDVSGVAHEEQVAIRTSIYDAGLAWVHFPRGFGGLAGPMGVQRVVADRLVEAGLKPLAAGGFFGLALAGPTIVAHGSDELKTRTLKRMFTGEDIWCQLFSEPGAGSDLASLAARATRDGDEWVVTGQKVWNTGAHLADKGLLITRSDPDVPKHRGMTYFMVDMHAPGVEVRPLRQMTGEAEFNEVYLTEVRIPDADRVGDVGDGWRVAGTTLANERNAIALGTASRKASTGGGPTAELLHWYRLSEKNPVQRDATIKAYIAGELLRLTNQRAGAARAAGKQPGAEGSVSKLAMANFVQTAYDLSIDLMGAQALAGFDYSFRRPEAVGLNLPVGSARHLFLRTRASSIEGGSSEIQRNILGERILGLPAEPRNDKDVPWSQVPRS